MSGEAPRRAWRWAALALVAAVAAAFHAVLGPSRGLLARDHALVFRPLWWAVAEQLRAHQWPVMGLAHAGGMPIEQSVNAATYTPTALLFWALPFDVAYDLHVVAHVAWLALGALALARRLGADPASATTCAALAALGGPVLSFENLLVGLQGLAWTPWVLLALARALSTPGPGPTAGLALATALQLEGAMPETVLLDVLGAAFLWARARPAITARLAATLVGAGALAAVLAAVDLLPLFEGLRGSRRLAGFDAAERAGWSLHPLQAIELIAPTFWSPPSLAYFNVPSVTGSAEDPPYLWSLYVGAGLPLALAAPPRDRRVWALAAVALLSVAAAAGDATPLYGWLGHVPLLSSSRYAIKYLLPFTAALAALAAMTVADLEACAPRLRALAALHATAGALLWWSLGTDEFHAWLVAQAKPLWSAGAFEAFRDPAVIDRAIAVMRPAALWALLSGTALLALAALADGRSETRRRMARGLVVAVVLADLGSAGPRLVTAVPLADVALPPEAERALPAPGARIYVDYLAPVPDRADRTPMEAYYLQQGRYGLLALGRVRRLDDPDLDGQGSRLHQAAIRALSGLDPARAEVLLRRAGVTRVVSGHALPGSPLAEYGDAGGAPVRWYALDGRPRIEIAARWGVVTASAAIDALTDPARADRALLVDPGFAAATTASCAATVAERPTSDPTRVELDVRADCEAVVVLREVRVPRWAATIDGAESPLSTAELGYLATRVDPGEHHVVFEYRALTPRAAWISLAGLVACAALGLWARTARQRASIGACPPPASS